MPFPDEFREAIQSKKFWIDYILNRIDEPKWPAFGRRCRVDIAIGAGYRLVFDLRPYLYQTDLWLRCPRRRRPLLWLARDDLAYWPREVLRWPEAELLSRAAARRDEELSHPGLLLVLLYRFTPLTAGDDRRSIWSLMRQAFGSLGVLSGRAVERCLREGTSDERDNLVWCEQKCGWVLKYVDSENYEHPRAPKSKFPFREFAAALQVAERIAAKG